MTDEEVLEMKATLILGRRLAWLSGGTAMEISRIVDSIESNNEDIAEPGSCAYLLSGYIALDNVFPADIYVISSLFEED